MELFVCGSQFPEVDFTTYIPWLQSTRDFEFSDSGSDTVNKSSSKELDEVAVKL